MFSYPRFICMAESIIDGLFFPFRLGLGSGLALGGDFEIGWVWELLESRWGWGKRFGFDGVGVFV